MDSKEDPLVKISVEDDEQDTNNDIQSMPEDNPQNNNDSNDDQHYHGRVTRSKTNSLPQQISRFSSSSTHHPLVNYSAINHSTSQYPWASNEIVNNLRIVKILQ